MTYNGKVPRYRTLLYETAAGVAVVANKLGSIAKSSHQSFTAIQTGIEMLEQYGPDPGLNRFKLLRHVEGAPLWELRANGRPAYRVLFMPVPGMDAFVLLHVVTKEDMARDSAKCITQALEHFEHWLSGRQETGEANDD